MCVFCCCFFYFFFFLFFFFFFSSRRRHTRCLSDWSSDVCSSDLGGGAAALSTGLTYFGGGTRIQRACGFDDSLPDMRAYVRLAAGAGADPERVRLYCEGSLEHFEWF